MIAEDVGFSIGRLQRITSLMQGAIDRGEIGGAVTLIARHGKVAYYQALGLQDIAAGTPMVPDTIFRIASMAKPIAVAATRLL